jgi:hypothetical protein
MAAHLDHPSFTQPADANVWLWRYMDLSKFAALVQRQTLVFARADNLGDPFEGSVPLLNADTAQQVLALRKADPENDPHKGMPDDEVVQMYRRVSEVRKQATKAHYISCWHMNEAESAGMWKLYSRSSDAVCVRTEYSTLASLLPDSVSMGLINYVDYKAAVIRADNLFNPFPTIFIALNMDMSGDGNRAVIR